MGLSSRSVASSSSAFDPSGGRRRSSMPTRRSQPADRAGPPSRNRRQRLARRRPARAARDRAGRARRRAVEGVPVAADALRTRSASEESRRCKFVVVTVLPRSDGPATCRCASAEPSHRRSRCCTGRCANAIATVAPNHQETACLEVLGIPLDSPTVTRLLPGRRLTSLSDCNLTDPLVTSPIRLTERPELSLASGCVAVALVRMEPRRHMTAAARLMVN